MCNRPHLSSLLSAQPQCCQARKIRLRPNKLCRSLKGHCWYLCGQCVSWEVIREAEHFRNEAPGNRPLTIAGCQTPAISAALSKSPVQPRYDCVAAGCGNMTQVCESSKNEKKKKVNNQYENSIKSKLEASDKFMEMKVLCKSYACLAMCRITRGLRYIAFKWAPSQNSAATPKRPKTQYCIKVWSAGCIF